MIWRVCGFQGRSFVESRLFGPTRSLDPVRSLGGFEKIAEKELLEVNAWLAIVTVVIVLL